MKKLLKWLGITILVLLVLLITLPFLFKGKIVALVKEQANKNLNAKVDFADVGLSLIRSFPNFSIGITNMSVVNVAPFEGDTLLFAKNLDVIVDLMSVIKGDQIRIRKVVVNESVMNFLVNSEGKANWDIAKSSGEPAQASEPSSFKANLNYYAVKNSRILYDDRSLGFRMLLDKLNHEGSGDFTQDLFVLRTETACDALTMNYGGVDYLNRVKTKIDADLDMDMKNFKFTFKDNKINLNDLNLGFSGWLAMPDTNMDMDLKFSAQQSEFKNFISLIPAVYSSDFSNAKASGKLSFDGWAKGRFNGASMPGFGLKLDIDNGNLKYPSLPSELKNVFVNLSVQNPDGDLDHTAVDLTRMHLEMAGDPFDAKLSLRTPISDPDFDASLKGKIDFGSIGKIVPLEKGTTLSGILTADFAAKGRYSYVKSNQYDRFNANGTIAINGMSYSDSSMKLPVLINQLVLTFNPRTVALTAFDMKAGKTDMQATGSLENFIPYALKGETLTGRLSLNSRNIDLNEWMSEDEKAASSGDTTSMTAPEIPGNIDFAIGATIAKLVYTNIEMTNCSGKIAIRNKAIEMNGLKMNLLDGSMVMNGRYAAENPQKPDMSFRLNMSNFDIQKTASTFGTVEKIAPVVKSCAGKFSCDLDLKSALDNHLNLLLPTLSGSGKLSSPGIVISGSKPVEKLADALKMEKLKKLAIQKVSLSFLISDGRLIVQPFDVDLAGIPSTVSGSNGFDQSIDYTMNMKIPRSSFGSAANDVVDNLLSKASSKGVNLGSADVIPVGVKIGGTVTNPKISTDIASLGTKVVDDLKAAAAAEFEKRKAEAEAKLKAETDKVKAEAQKKMDEGKAKAQAEADRLKKEAEAKTKAATDSAKKAAEKKAKEELDKFNPFKKK